MKLQVTTIVGATLQGQTMLDFVDQPTEIQANAILDTIIQEKSHLTTVGALTDEIISFIQANLTIPSSKREAVEAVYPAGTEFMFVDLIRRQRQLQQGSGSGRLVAMIPRDGVDHLTGTTIPAIPAILGFPGQTVSSALASASPDVDSSDLFQVKVLTEAPIYVECAPGDETCSTRAADALEQLTPGERVVFRHGFYPPSPPAPPVSPPPSPPPPPPPPLPKPPPPFASTCGCSQYLNGLSPTALASSVCTKVQSVSLYATQVVCSPANTGTGRCSSDYTPCIDAQYTTGDVRCTDEPGRWAARKCAKKMSKGKCNKRRVRGFCPSTCRIC